MVSAQIARKAMNRVHHFLTDLAEQVLGIVLGPADDGHAEKQSQRCPHVKSIPVV
jgi:hypothetical protein